MQNIKEYKYKQEEILHTKYFETRNSMLLNNSTSSPSSSEILF